jgi:hypothetical protein
MRIVDQLWGWAAQYFSLDAHKTMIHRGRMATELLKRAFKLLADLPDYEQDEIGRRLIDAIEKDDDRLWEAAINYNEGATPFDKLEERALVDIVAGRAEPLDPDKL